MKAAKTIKKKYGTKYYERLGAKGGLAQVPKGFSMSKSRASDAGKVGGAKSRRGPAHAK